MRNKPDAVLTVCLVCKDGKVLLAQKKEGELGVGLLNGYGGHVEDGREIVVEAKRELEDESGLEAILMEEIGVIIFKFKETGKILECHFFRVDDFKGELKETTEMGLGQWYVMDEKLIPLEQMWEGDKLWIPYFLKRQKFHGWIVYNNKEERKVLDHFISANWNLEISVELLLGSC